MTCIVGYTNGKNVVIGGDSAGVGGYSISERKDKKVYKVGDLIFGGTYSFRMIQILGYSWKPPRIEFMRDPMDYMVNSLVPSIFETYKNSSFYSSSGGQARGCGILVGLKGRLFHIMDDFQVGENILPFDSTGCGSDIALGAMHNLFDADKRYGVKEIKEKLNKALISAEKFSAGVTGPFHFVNT